MQQDIDGGLWRREEESRANRRVMMMEKKTNDEAIGNKSFKIRMWGENRNRQNRAIQQNSRTPGSWASYEPSSLMEYSTCWHYDPLTSSTISPARCATFCT